jgi:hypothetical protein
LTELAGGAGHGQFLGSRITLMGSNHAASHRSALRRGALSLPCAHARASPQR